MDKGKRIIISYMYTYVNYKVELKWDAKFSTIDLFK